MNEKMRKINNDKMKYKNTAKSLDFVHMVVSAGVPDKMFYI